jgi:hypothetical protein
MAGDAPAFAPLAQGQTRRPRGWRGRPPERLVSALRVSFLRAEYADLTEAYELVIDGEPFTVEVIQGVVATRPGRRGGEHDTGTRDRCSGPRCMMTDEVTTADLLAGGGAALEGKRSGLEGFIDAVF